MWPRALALSSAAALFVSALAAHAAPAPNLAGRWSFSAAKSQNVGMMADVAMTTVIVQSPDRVVVDDTSLFQGHTYAEHTVYDLAGGVSQNVSPMTGASTGHSHWDGDVLVTDWERPGAVAGATVHRRETRRLAAAGRGMVVESSSPGKAPMVMVFDRP